MPPTRSIVASAVTLAAGLALFAAAPARAQGLPSVGNTGKPLMNNQTPQAVPEAPPPALPGATATYKPAERTASDLSPTDALFDAINRGDIASARDAVNRGADLGGRNILGMAPLDLSVDLSRNDITFLLLSLRAGSAPTGPAIASGAAPAPNAKTPPGKKTAAAPAKPAPKVAAAAPRPAPSPVHPAAPQQFAGPADTGTPNPQAGFLGFGGTVQ